MAIQLTDLAIEALATYLRDLQALGNVEPPMYDDIEHDTQTSPAWEKWNAKVAKLTADNRELIKALKYDTEHTERDQGKSYPVKDIIKGVIALLTVNTGVVTSARIDKQDFPLDRVNSDVWRLLQRTKPDAQLTIQYIEHRGITEGEAFALDAANSTDKKLKKQVPLYYALDFEALGANTKITKKLEPYDERVYMAVSALFNAGYSVISLGQIYEAMAYNGAPNARDKKRINDSITKMNSAHIFIDNQQEGEAGYKYDSFKYDASLLPMERLQAVINGNSVEAIHIFREPPLMSFARGRNHLTTVRREVLDSPLSKNNSNIAIENYLIERIAHIDNGFKNTKLDYETIYSYAGITTSKQKQRAPEKIRKVLDHYVKIGHIRAYKEDAAGVTLIVQRG